MRDIPTETAAAVLFAGMKDPDPEVRVAICEAWGTRASIVTKPIRGAQPARSEEDAATRLLATALSGDTDVNVRLAAARSLGKIKNDPRAVGALGIALKDQDPALQYRAVASLKEISHQDFGNNVVKWQQYVRQRRASNAAIQSGRRPAAKARIARASVQAGPHRLLFRRVAPSLRTAPAANAC